MTNPETLPNSLSCQTQAGIDSVSIYRYANLLDRNLLAKGKGESGGGIYVLDSRNCGQAQLECAVLRTLVPCLSGPARIRASGRGATVGRVQ